MKRLWILGSGGHAHVVIDTARAIGDFEIAGILDDDPRRLGTHVSGVEVVGPITRESVVRFGIERAVIAVGANRARFGIAARLEGTVAWTTLVHPRAYVAAHTRLGAGTVVFAGAVVQPGARLGDHVILNTHCSVDHDGAIGDFAHIAPGAHLAGDVRVGPGAFVGLNVGIVPGIDVGEWATVGAGAIVLRDVAPRSTVVGVPATLLER